MGTKDKRHFKRYTKVSEISLRSKGREFIAETTDYSLIGFGAVMKNAHSLQKGDIVEISISDPEISTLGEIVWVGSGPQGSRIGIRCVGNLRGRIRDFRLADTLIGLQRSQKTGILIVERGETIKKVFVKNGDMVFAASNLNDDRLGDVLLREGKISLEQYEKSVKAMQESKERQGAVLVRLGYLKPQELVTAVRHYIEEIILSLFAFDDGSFVFQENPLPHEEVITLQLSAANLIYYGIKRIKSLNLVMQALPSLDVVPLISTHPIDLFQDIRFDKAGKEILSLIDGILTFKQIISLLTLDSFEALKTLYGLMSISMVETVQEMEQGHVAFAEMPKEVIQEIVGSTPEEPQDAAIKTMIEEMHGKIHDIGYYGALGVTDTSSQADIKTAYYRQAKKFHPDMHFHIADSSLKDKLSKIFAYLNDSYATLSDPVKRREYDRSIKIRPASLTATQGRAREFFEAGKKELESGNLEDAIRYFEEALRFDKTISDHFYYYGLTLNRQFRVKDAEEALKGALSLDPYNPLYLTELGYIYLQLGARAKAREQFAKALKVSPSHTRASDGLTRAG